MACKLFTYLATHWTERKLFVAILLRFKVFLKGSQLLNLIQFNSNSICSLNVQSKWIHFIIQTMRAIYEVCEVYNEMKTTFFSFSSARHNSIDWNSILISIQNCAAVKSIFQFLTAPRELMWSVRARARARHTSKFVGAKNKQIIPLGHTRTAIMHAHTHIQFKLLLCAHTSLWWQF